MARLVRVRHPKPAPGRIRAPIKKTLQIWLPWPCSAGMTATWSVGPGRADGHRTGDRPEPDYRAGGVGRRGPGSKLLDALRAEDPLDSVGVQRLLVRSAHGRRGSVTSRRRSWPTRRQVSRPRSRLAGWGTLGSWATTGCFAGQQARGGHGGGGAAAKKDVFKQGEEGPGTGW